MTPRHRSLRVWIVIAVILSLDYVAQGFRRFTGNHLTGRAVPYNPSRQVDTWLRLLGETTTNRAPNSEISRRRNFATISHPDAGKTTFTEKLLLFGGAIQDAGAVKARADQRRATSDWMEIEKQRGISVTSTVLSFAFNSNQQDYQLNLVDTPGHQDFSEDTYRALAAADNCVMLIDAAKGIEERTRKLFDVCQMRKLPIFTFVNKMDRPSLSQVEVIDQLEKEFSLQCIPMNWPIGDGNDFQVIGISLCFFVSTSFINSFSFYQCIREYMIDKVRLSTCFNAVIDERRSLQQLFQLKTPS